ncbi:pre-toxin TG domain-containing protein [Mesobacillus foraminis]|uniref:pre-toxin TG domain-containing protein n=1 Tax=Mesobacillus foraminis TaxID=279826 RepID=UPI000EF4C9FF|nr:pre-toxin TG domain-containing protein [Mesobacillus foraminis]
MTSSAWPASYDPVTAEKLSAGDKALAGLMLALTIFPPAKAVGVGDKAVSMGVKAGKGAAAFAAIAKTPEVFKGIRKVVSTQKVQKAFKQVYNDVVVAPFPPPGNGSPTPQKQWGMYESRPWDTFPPQQEALPLIKQL